MSHSPFVDEKERRVDSPIQRKLYGGTISDNHCLETIAHGKNVEIMGLWKYKYLTNSYHAQ